MQYPYSMHIYPLLKNMFQLLFKFPTCKIVFCFKFYTIIIYASITINEQYLSLFTQNLYIYIYIYIYGHNELANWSYLNLYINGRKQYKM